MPRHSSTESAESQRYTNSNNAATNKLRSKATEYGNFISKTLEPQLRAAVTARDETESEISEYAGLRAQLELLLARFDDDKKDGEKSSSRSRPLGAMVDLCHGAAYCPAVIPNPRTVYVHVGLGFHAEFTLIEAISFIGKRLDYLESEVLEQRSDAADAVASDVEKSLELLEELGEELKELEER